MTLDQRIVIEDVLQRLRISGSVLMSEMTTVMVILLEDLAKRDSQ